MSPRPQESSRRGQAQAPGRQRRCDAPGRGGPLGKAETGSSTDAREPAKVFLELAEAPSVEIRTKRDHGAPMHLKSYEIDGRLLRTGAANFSASGEKRQD